MDASDSNVLSGRSNSATQAKQHPKPLLCALMHFNLIGLEAEQLSRLVHDALLLLVEWNHVAHFLDVFPEIPLVELFVQHGFIQVLELAQGEFLREQFKTDVVRFQLGLQRFDGSI